MLQPNKTDALEKGLNTMWKLRNESSARADIDRVRRLAEKCSTYPLFIQILINRGYNDEDIVNMLLSPLNLIKTYTQPLKNSVEAAESIHFYLTNNSRIAVFCDYDCDGITSGYVMVKGLREISQKNGYNSQIVGYWPERDEGYGLNMEFCRKCIKAKTDLVITVDNGIAQNREVTFLKNNGIDVIITDHHMLKRGIAAPNTLIVNPSYFKEERNYLAGVGVAYEVIKRVNDIAHKRINPLQFLDAVTIGTLTDVMPMSPENVATISLGLWQINNGHGHRLFDEYKSKCPITAKDISWTIGPEINAAGRMGETWTAVQAFFDEENTSSIIKKLGRLNYKRKKITDEALENINYTAVDASDRFIAMNIPDAPKGMIGIIAGKMTDKFPEYPCYAYQEDENGICYGSIRCANEEVPLNDLLANELEDERILNYAGHNSACVMEIEKSKLNEFIAHFSACFDKVVDIKNKKETDILFDGIAPLSIATENNMNVFNMIPYAKNQEPTFVLNNLLVTEHRETQSGGGFLKISDNTATKKVFLLQPIFKKYLALGCPNVINIIANIEQDFMKKTPSATLRIKDIAIAE